MHRNSDTIVSFALHALKSFEAMARTRESNVDIEWTEDSGSSE